MALSHHQAVALHVPRSLFAKFHPSCGTGFVLLTPRCWPQPPCGQVCSLQLPFDHHFKCRNAYIKTHPLDVGLVTRRSASLVARRRSSFWRSDSPAWSSPLWLPAAPTTATAPGFPPATAQQPPRRSSEPSATGAISCRSAGRRSRCPRAPTRGRTGQGGRSRRPSAATMSTCPPWGSLSRRSGAS